MTLIIRIVTPQGLVLCSDSLVSYHDTISDIFDWDETRRVGSIVPAGEISDGSPFTLMNPQWKENRRVVRNTAQNVTKTSGILDLPIALSIAGSGTFLGGGIRDNIPNAFPVSFESFVPTIERVVSNLIEQYPEVTMREICECICFVLACGASGAQPFSGNEGWKLRILGGAVDKDRPWPMMFDLNVNHRGQNREYRMTILEGMVTAIGKGIMESLPGCLSSADPFAEFCDGHLERVLAMGMNNAAIWSSWHNFDPDILQGRIFEDCMEVSRKTLLLIGRIFRNWGLEGFSSYQISDVMMEMWKLRKDGYHDKDLNKLFDSKIKKFNLESDFLKDLLSEYENQSGFKDWASETGIRLSKHDGWIFGPEEIGERENVEKRINYAFPRHSDVVYFRLPEKIRSTVSRESFNGITRLFGEPPIVTQEEGFVDCCVIGDLMFDDSYFSPPFDWFGINQEGQTDVVERIMSGMDEAARREQEFNIREYVTDAIDMLAGKISGTGTGSKDMSPEAIERMIASAPKDEHGNLISDSGPYGQYHGVFVWPDGEDGDSEEELVQLSVELRGMPRYESFGSGDSEIGPVDVEIRKLEDGDYNVIVTFHERLDEWGVAERHSIPFGINDDGAIKGTIPKEDGSSSFVELMLFPDYSKTRDEGDIGGRVADAKKELETELEQYRLATQGWDVDFANMPLKTSVELAHYLMESTIKKQHFNSEVPTVGGRVKTLTISPKGVREEFFNDFGLG